VPNTFSLLLEASRVRQPTSYKLWGVYREQSLSRSIGATGGAIDCAYSRVDRSPRVNRRATGRADDRCDDCIVQTRSRIEYEAVVVTGEDVRQCGDDRGRHAVLERGWGGDGGEGRSTDERR